MPATRPAQHRTKAVQVTEPPGLPPVAAVRPVELELLTRGGLDRHADCGGPPATHPAHLAQVTHQGRVRAGEALGPKDPFDRGGQQLGVGLEQLGHPGHPVLRDRRGVAGRRPPLRWRASLLQPRRHGGRVTTERIGDLADGPALASKCDDVHVLLLSQHDRWDPPVLGDLCKSPGWGVPHRSRWMVPGRTETQINRELR